MGITGATASDALKGDEMVELSGNPGELPAAATSELNDVLGMGGVVKLPADYTKLLPHERRAVREEYIRLQGGKCQHCGKPLTEAAADEIMSKPINVRLFPPNFFKYPVHLHHCHGTGMTIGAVHCHCNAVLWQYHGE